MVQARPRRAAAPAAAERGPPGRSRVRSLAKVSAAACTAGSSGSSPATRIQTQVLVSGWAFGSGVERVLEQPLLDRQADAQRARATSPCAAEQLEERGRLSGAGTSGIGSACSATASSPAMDVGGQREDRDVLALRRCQADHPAGAERPAVADPLDGVADLLVRVARPQEVGVQRVHPAPSGSGRPAAISAWPATCPPKIRCSGVARRLPDEEVAAPAPRGRAPTRGPRPGCRRPRTSRVGARLRARGSGWWSRRCSAGCPRRPPRGRRPCSRPMDSSESRPGRTCRRCAHRRHQEGLHAPGQRQLVRTRASAVKASSGRRGAARPAGARCRRSG